MNKELYGEIFMEEEKLKNNGIYHPIKIDYYKTEKIMEDKNVVKYGIEVVKTEYKEETKIETNKLYEISNNEKDIDEILKIFKENEVTPIGAEDVLEDYFYGIINNK